MVNFNQGPGRNIEFFLITTGLNIDPDHGCFNREVYQWLKNVILQRAEIHFENRIIRETHDRDVSSFLEGYSSDPRTAYQFLFGLVEHSNGWTEETLTNAIDETPFFQIIDPQDEEYSIDFVASKDAGMTLFENLLVSFVDVWVEKQEFYYSSCKPQLLDGEPGDIWFVSDGFDVELWYKPVFQWVRLEDYVKTQTPAGTVTYSTTDPGNTTNSWWFDLTGLDIRKYSVQLNSWEPVSSVTVSPTPPGGLLDGDLWLNVVDGKFLLSVFDSSTSSFRRVKFSAFAVQDRDTNSAFVGTPGNNNFIIVSGDEALNGAPITGLSDLKVKKDSVLIQTAVDCINFIGPDLEVTAGDSGEVDIEHLPFTCLPEQSSAPTAVPEAGKVFTLDIGGITELFYIDDTGNLIQLTNNGITIQNVFFAVSTSSAVDDQTIFSVPAAATVILAFKINGVDTTAFTFSSPTVTYLPGTGGYDIQDGDVVTILFYG